MFIHPLSSPSQIIHINYNYYFLYRHSVVENVLCNFTIFFLFFSLVRFTSCIPFSKSVIFNVKIHLTLVVIKFMAFCGWNFFVHYFFSRLDLFSLSGFLCLVILFRGKFHLSNSFLKHFYKAHHMQFLIRWFQETHRVVCCCSLFARKCKIETYPAFRFHFYVIYQNVCFLCKVQQNLFIYDWVGAHNFCDYV